jgi:hypothetical protein
LQKQENVVFEFVKLCLEGKTRFWEDGVKAFESSAAYFVSLIICV